MSCTMSSKIRAFPFVNISQTFVVIHQHGFNRPLPILVYTLSDKPSHYVYEHVDIVIISNVPFILSY